MQWFTVRSNNLYIAIHSYFFYLHGAWCFFLNLYGDKWVVQMGAALLARGVEAGLGRRGAWPGLSITLLAGMAAIDTEGWEGRKY